MTLALIAAAAGKNLVIGKDGDLPWHFSADLKHFKATTLNHAVLMGRVTYQSIVRRLGKPLPGRENIVLTRDKSFHDDRATVIHDLTALARYRGNDELLFVIGGGEIYRQTVGIADLIYMTHIDKEVAGDTFFPPLDAKTWYLKDEQTALEDGVTLRFCVYERLRNRT